MKIEEQFTIAAPVDEVWAFLIDPRRVAAALPGAEISEQLDDTTFKGGMAVKVGPVSVDYRGTVSFTLDEPNRAASVHAKGQGMAGMGSADMRMQSRVEALAERETRVVVESDVTISGVLAQFGRGMIEQVSRQMFQQFSAAVKAELETS